MLKLLSLLQTRRDWPGHVLAERLEVSVRTVRRDVDRLREMGYRIRAIKGLDGGYRLDAGSELPPLLFDDDQAVALVIALQTASASGARIAEAAAQALATVRQVMPSRLRHRIDGVAFKTLPAADAGTTAVDPMVLVAVTAAAREHLILRFDYTHVGHSASERGALRRAEPHHVVAAGGRWYLLAWDLDRNAWRVFRLDRMTPRTPAGPRFTPRTLPDRDVGNYLSARFRGSDQAGTWPFTGEVVLGLPAREVGPYVPDGIVEELGSDRCRVIAGSWSWVALAAAFGRFGATITDPAPSELAEAFRLLARRYASTSGKSSTQDSS